MSAGLDSISTATYLYIATTLVTLIMVLVLINKRKTPGAVYLLRLFFSFFVWSFGIVFESASDTVEMKEFWSGIAYIGTVFSPVLLLLFAVDYSGLPYFKRKWHIIALIIIPAITLILALSNSLHGLIWPKITIHPETSMAVYGHGPVFWIFIAYTYLLIIPAWIFLLGTLRNIHKKYRYQNLLIILAVSAGVGGNILYLIPDSPFPGFDWTLAGLIIGSLVLSLDIFRLKLFDLVPTARTTLVEIMDEGVLLVDVKGRILDINPSFLHLAEMDESDDLIGKDVAIALRNSPVLLRFFEDVFSLEQPLRTEIRLKSKTLDVNVQELRHKKDFSSGRLMVLNDITSLKETENRLYKTNLQLSEEIEVKQKLIEELDAYAHTVAHDLKSPVNQIAGFSELLYEESLTGDCSNTTTYSKTINDSAFNLVHIIDELLLLASVRSADVKKTPVLVKSVFDASLKRLNQEITESLAVIHVETDWPVVSGYESWLQEIFVNYLSNAIKYGGNPPEIWIRSSVDNELVWYHVMDNGSGVPDELKKKLFVPYTRLAPTKAEGQGLGLSIVKRIIDKLNGQVRVENSQDKGAIFSFGLPASAE